MLDFKNFLAIATKYSLSKFRDLLSAIINTYILNVTLFKRITKT